MIKPMDREQCVSVYGAKFPRNYARAFLSNGGTTAKKSRPQDTAVGLFRSCIRLLTVSVRTAATCRRRTASLRTHIRLLAFVREFSSTFKILFYERRHCLTRPPMLKKSSVIYLFLFASAEPHVALTSQFPRCNAKNS